MVVFSRNLSNKFIMNKQEVQNSARVLSCNVRIVKFVCLYLHEELMVRISSHYEIRLQL